MNDVRHGNGEANRPGEPSGESASRDKQSGTGGGTVADWIKNAGAVDGGGGGIEGKGEQPAGGTDSRNRRSSRRSARKDGRGDNTDNGGASSATAGGHDGRAAADKSGETKPGTVEQKRSAETVPRVEKPAPRKVPLIVLPGGKKPTESLSEEFIAELWRMLYQIPHLAGYDDPSNPWWPLHSTEASALASPTARILARMSPTEQELFSRFADPIALVVTAVAITSFRAEMTREYVRAQKVHRATEARRAGLSRGIKESDVQRDRRDNGQDGGEPADDAARDAIDSHELIKDSFVES